MKAPAFLSKLVDFYKEGFRNMTLGRTLWAIVLIKLFIMFGILRVFFFPTFLNDKCDTAQEKAKYVSEQLVGK
jgi:hypothetical protein